MAGNWQNNPLFKRAAAAVAQKARREFQATSVGKLAKGLADLSRTGSLAGAARRDDWEKLVTDAGRRGLIPGFDPRTIERTLQRVTRYSLSDYALDALFEALGPVGGLLKDLTRTTRPGREQQRDHDIEAAINFLGSLGFEVLQPPGRRTPSTRQQNLAAQILEAAGWTVTAPGKGPASVTRPPRDRRRRRRTQPPTPPPTPTIAGAGGPMTAQPGELEPGGIGVGGIRQPGPPPALIRTPASTNVYAISYAPYGPNNKKPTLYVQFKAPTLNAAAITTTHQRTKKGKIRGVKRRGTLGKTVVGRSDTPGPIYAYFDVPPKVAAKIIAKAQAGEAGEAIWDYLRYRQTVHGHRYNYDLVGLGGKATLLGDNGMPAGQIRYVPRKAVHDGVFQRRTIELGRNPRTGARRVIRSLLPNEGLGPRWGNGPSRGLGPSRPTSPGLR